MQRHIVCRLSELPPGHRKLIQVGRKSIGIFNVDGRFYALLNHCPHQHAPLCLGPLTGTTGSGQSGRLEWVREGEIIRCPWHGWEFDVTTGMSVFNPHKVRTASYSVSLEPSCAEAPGMDSAEKEPSVESFPVSVENSLVVLHTP